MTSYAKSLDVSGTEYTIPNIVLDVSGASYNVSTQCLDVDGNSLTVFYGSTEEESHGGATTPYPLTLTPEMREEEEIVMMFCREYMKRLH